MTRARTLVLGIFSTALLGLHMGVAYAIATAQPSGQEVVRSPRWDVKQSTCAVLSAPRSSLMPKAGMQTVTSQSRGARASGRVIAPS